MAEELFKGLNAPKTEASKTEPSGNPAAPGEQKEPKAPATDANRTSSGPSSTTPPATKEQGKGNPAQTTQSPEDGKQAPSSSGSTGTQEAAADDEEDDLEMPSEIDMLKDRAKLMGIQFSNNIGVEALKAKIEEKRAATEAAAQPKQEPAPAATQTAAQTGFGAGAINALTGNETRPARPKSLRQYLRDEKMKLIRLRITNLDPKKKDLPGEIITVANEYIGTVRKFVPFGEVTDNGFHVPQCIYDLLKERTFVSIKTRKDQKGQTIVEHQNAREFALEILPQLTPEELAQLSAAQAAAGGL